MMANSIPDIWPDDFGDEAEAGTAPATILRQQGINLGRKTQNMVLGRVSSRGLGQDQFEHPFILYAPLLGYERPVLRVTHGLAFYPATVALEPVVRAPGVNRDDNAFDVTSADELLARLGEVFRSDKGKGLVRSLLAQSRPAASAP